MEFTGSAVSKSTVSRNGERRRIHQEPGSRVGIVIGGRAGKRISDAIGIDRVGKAQQSVVRGGNTVGTPRLHGHDTVQLPSAQPAASGILSRQEALSLSER